MVEFESKIILITVIDTRILCKLINSRVRWSHSEWLSRDCLVCVVVFPTTVEPPITDTPKSRQPPWSAQTKMYKLIFLINYWPPKYGHLSTPNSGQRACPKNNCKLTSENWTVGKIIVNFQQFVTQWHLESQLVFHLVILFHLGSVLNMSI